MPPAEKYHNLHSQTNPIIPGLPAHFLSNHHYPHTYPLPTHTIYPRNLHLRGAITAQVAQIQQWTILTKRGTTHAGQISDNFGIYIHQIIPAQYTAYNMSRSVHTRASKARAQELLKKSVRDSMRKEEEEEEVGFYPESSNDSSLNDTVPHSFNTRSEASANQSSNVEARVSTLEADVAHVKSKIGDVDAKLDILLSATNFRPVKASTPPGLPTPRTPWTHTPAPGLRDPTPTQTEYALPHPRILRHQQNREGYVDEMIRRERFVQPQVDGKARISSNIYAENEMPKPYMYISREGIQTLKQKLDIRASLSMPEYVNASIALLMDKRAYHPGDADHVLAHIQDVTHDVLLRPWEGIRRWSQHVWDEVEKGNITWDQHQIIHNQRVMMAITANRQSAGPETRSRRECICRAFNSRPGCKHRTHHDDGQLRFMHLCSFCDSDGRQCTGHNVVACESKLRGAQPRQGFASYNSFPPPPQPRNNTSDGQWRQSQPASTYQQFSQYPKNGPQAPQWN